MRLECLAQYTLHGNVMSMQAVQLIGSPRDSLLLSFREAKLSVVEYDTEIHSLRTVSLHYFEEEEIKVCQVFYIYIQPVVIYFRITNILIIKTGWLDKSSPCTYSQS